MNENRQAFSERLAQVFKQEAQGRLSTMRVLLNEAGRIDSSPSSSRLIPLQLEMHSLKGAARSVERCDIEMLCQDAETLLIDARERESGLPKEVLQGLHELIDYLDGVVARSAGDLSDHGSNSLHAKLSALVTASRRARNFPQGKSLS